jgi:hypothetical protein
VTATPADRDEWLNIDHAMRVTEAVALILDAHVTR